MNLLNEIQKFKEKALELDADDPLASFKDRFVNADNQLIYLDGNSLGKLPIKTQQLVNQIIEKQWGEELIRGWNAHWVGLPSQLASKIAKIIGAQEDEVFVGDTTTLNFYKLVFGALKMMKGRNKIITDNLNFPSDIYVLQGLIHHHFNDHKLEIIKSEDGISIKTESIQHALDKETALLALSYVVFKSSYMYNMKQVNALANAQDALVIWDLSHAVGAVPINLNETNADLAVGCTYKYLNGGPGSPAFLYVSKRLQAELESPIWGWFGHQSPFNFDLDFQAQQSVWKHSIGTPAIVSMAAIEPGLDLILEAGILNLRAKSLNQSTFMIEMINELLLPIGFHLASPENENQRGSHISVQHEEGFRISQAMISPRDGSKAIIPDFRPPNNIRLGIAPLYNTYSELFESIIRMHTIVVEKQFELYSSTRDTIT